MEKEISFTEAELGWLTELVEIALEETSPAPDESLRTLANKLELSEHTQKWIQRMLNK